MVYFLDSVMAEQARQTVAVLIIIAADNRIFFCETSVVEIINRIVKISIISPASSQCISSIIH